MISGPPPEVVEYIDAIPAARRPLFDRIDALIRQLHPEIDLVWAYKMPTYVVGERRIHVAAWAHGISLYGWDGDDDGGFVERHPETSSGRGTIRLTPAVAADLPDDELLALLAGALRQPTH